jgi:hypothetical protein
MKKTFPTFLFICFFNFLHAQMWDGQDTLYGNEWIRYDQPYFKLKIFKDGIYRIPYSVLKTAGLGDITGNRFQLFWEGKEQALTVSSGERAMQENDYLEFYGQRNQGQFDRHLYENPAQDQLNPFYSLYSDTSVYFLTIAPIGKLTRRYTTIEKNENDNPAPITWCWRTSEVVFQQTFTDARYDGENLITFSSYDTGEGFGSGYARSRQIDLSLEGLLPTQAASLAIRLFSNSAYYHQLSLRTRPSKNQSGFSDQIDLLDSLDRYTLKTYQLSLPPSALTASMQVLIDGKIDANDQYSVAYVQCRYPAELRMGQKDALVFELDAAAQPSFLEFTDLPSNGHFCLYSLTRQTVVFPTFENKIARFFIPAISQNTRFVLLNQDKAPETVTALEPVFFTDYRSTQADFILISHPKLLSDQEGRKQLEAYATYRNSTAGGGFSTLLLSVQDLYNQFGYGHAEHPQGLRNFVFWWKKKQTKPPFIFLIGHGVDYVKMRKDQGKLRPLHLIPPFGVPGSDRLLFSLNGKTAPILPFGRQAVTEPAQIRAYLDKVMAHEKHLREDRQLDQAAWHKRVLHIVGGNPSDQESFKNHINNLSNTITNNGFGAQLTTVVKENTDAVQRSTAEAVIQSVNQGVAIKTFFGHGAVTNTDFGLDDPQIFDNKERYPVFFSLGCLTGYLYDQQNSLSERFVLAPERGAIAYVASAGYAYPFALETYMQTFYKLLGDKEECTRSMGELLQKTCQLLESQAQKSFGLRSLLEQISYHGDPAIRLRLFALPDFTFDAASVQLTPATPNVFTDSITIAGRIVNLGFNYQDTIEVEVKRVLPNATARLYRKKIKLNGFATAIQFKLPTLGDTAAGINKLYLSIDPNNKIKEAPEPFAKENNQLRSTTGIPGYTFIVQSNAFALLSPADESIITKRQQPLQLIIGASDPRTEGKFVFEVDSLRSFDSAAKLTTKVIMIGGRASWIPPLNYWHEGKVYYWRARVDSISDPNVLPIASFKYSGPSPGWNQSHYQQFQTNQFQQLEWPSFVEGLRFQTRLNNIIGESIAMGSANSVPTRYLYNNNRIFRVPFWWGWGKAICIAVFDPLTGQPWLNPPGGKFGAYNLEGSPLTAFVFKMDRPQEREKIVRFLENEIPAGHYVLLLTHHDEGQSFFAEQWAADSLVYSKNLFQVLEQNGAHLIRQLEKRGTLPYIFAYINKGKVLGEGLANSNAETRTLWFDLPETLTQGSMKPQRIGPARRWQALHWQYQSDDASDQVKWQLNALSTDGQKRLSVWQGAAQGDSLDISAIDATQFPFMEWTAQFQDSVLRTPTQLQNWQALYEGIGDAAIRLGQPWGWRQDTVQQGQALEFRAPVYNAGNGQLDSITVQFTLFDQFNRSTVIRRKIGAIAQGDSLMLQQSWDTRQLEGACRLIIELNPERQTPELYAWNNIGTLNAWVKTDKSAPLVDVTFDGTRILNNDLVSSRPLITIQISDENRFLPLQDTSLITLKITGPKGLVLTPKFDQIEAAFFPASNNKNQARVEWKPQIELDGEYTLQIRARDASGNLSGNGVYAIHFRVQREQTLSQLLPYPNPCTSHCRFWYTLTGDSPLEQFQLQILTISGKAVRHVNSTEFGPLKVGVHLSDFVWDGTDDFGDRLANGVYLYRVSAYDAQGLALKLAATAADGFFQNGLGKIVLLK